MKLEPKQPSIKVTWPIVREDKEVVDKLELVAQQNNISLSEALRQLLVNFAEHPFALNKTTATNNKTGVYPPLQLERKVIDLVRKTALTKKLSQAEALRQIVRKYLSSEGQL